MLPWHQLLWLLASIYPNNVGIEPWISHSYSPKASFIRVLFSIKDCMGWVHSTQGNKTVLPRNEWIRKCVIAKQGPIRVFVSVSTEHTKAEFLEDRVIIFVVPVTIQEPFHMIIF